MSGYCQKHGRYADGTLPGCPQCRAMLPGASPAAFSGGSDQAVDVSRELKQIRDRLKALETLIKDIADRMPAKDKLHPSIYSAETAEELLEALNRPWPKERQMAGETEEGR